MEKKRLKDDTFDPYGYEDDPRTDRIFIMVFVLAFVIVPAIEVGLIVYVILKYADVIDKWFT